MIKPEEISRRSLEEILGYDKDGRETYEFIEGSTNMHLFSRYKERR